jgi:euchromatic histone-lysine N-methyltransferase
MANNKPIAERDYPPGCRPPPPLQGPVLVPANGRRMRSPNPNGEPQPGRVPRTPSFPSTPSTPRPSIDVVWNFEPDPNDTPEELYAKRRKRYAALLGYFQQLQERGELPGKGRPDLEATKRMTQDKQTFDWKGVGHVPGTAVGDFFYYRTELYVVGLHRAMQAGISQVDLGGDKIGCSIVASGGYEDDEDHGETMMYTGHGGNNKSDKRQVRDQVPEGGNLALKNSCYKGQPVRVIRGHSNIPTNQSPSKKLYSYDGLYNVISESLEFGNSGFRVFKFKLERRPGQPELGSRLVSFVGKLNKGTERRTGVVMTDISEGQEPIPVGVVNTVDNTRPPSSFEYTTTLRYPRGFSLPSYPITQCSCQDCSTDHQCGCVAKNAGRMTPYNQFGQLVRALPAVYECGKLCGCSQDCHNRVCQKGLRYRLEIFKTENKGWGVRSWDFIPSGGFVCEYTGEVMDTNTANEMDDDEYLFNLDFKQGNEARWGDKISNLLGGDVVREQPQYVIDASKYGGVARFINHSCKPNLFVQCVLYDDCNLDLPHVMLFAAAAIRPFQELTYDYGYALDSVFDENGLPKQKPCHCDARNCRKRMY